MLPIEAAASGGTLGDMVGISTEAPRVSIPDTLLYVPDMKTALSSADKHRKEILLTLGSNDTLFDLFFTLNGTTISLAVIILPSGYIKVNTFIIPLVFSINQSKLEYFK